MRPLSSSLLLVACTILAVPVANAQVVSDESALTLANPATIASLQQRLDAQQAELETLREQLQRFGDIYGIQPGPGDGTCAPEMKKRVPLVADITPLLRCDESPDQPLDGLEPFALRYYSDYAEGLKWVPFDPDSDAFDLRLNGWIQFRYHGFARERDSWTDQAGTVRPVQNRSAFDIERARLVFSGHAIDRRLTYFLQLDGDSDGSHAVDFFDYWWGWQANDAFQIQFGKRKVPNSLQWLLSARRTRFVDRPMANDFFRPDRTVGVFGEGRLGDHTHYSLMAANGYATSNLPDSMSDDRLAFAVAGWWQPGGNFGSQIVDFDAAQKALWHFGHGLVYAPHTPQVSGIPSAETTFVGLADGTRLTANDALAPGVSVSKFDVWLYTVEAAWKYRGWSWTSEGYLRWIDDLQGTGLLPIRSIFQHGGYIEGGKFLIPSKLDLNFRFSRVADRYGHGEEFAGGFNWYPLETHTLKCSLDLTYLTASPLQNASSDILVGDQGTLLRMQFQAEF